MTQSYIKAGNATNPGIDWAGGDDGTLKLVVGPESALVNAVEITAAGVVKMPKNKIAFHVTGNQTVPTTVDTKAILNNEQFDTTNAFDSTTNYRFQPQVAGYYQINVSVTSAAAPVSGGVVLAKLNKNGALQVVLIDYLNSNLTGLAASGSELVFMNGTTDYIELILLQTCGQNQAISTTMSGYLAIPD